MSDRTTYRARDWDGQTVHAASVPELGTRTLAAGTAQALWDVHKIDRDRQSLVYVGYMVGGELMEAAQ
jgi:hypothetical protein